MLNKDFQIVAAVLMLALLGQPLAACLAPGHTMTAAEHACCMKMATMCESSAMPMSHSCCKHAISPQAIAISKLQNRELAAAAAVLASNIAPALPTPSFHHNAGASGSPPGSPPKISTILRI
jgi:hypothetical protein